MSDISHLLKIMVDKDASDLFFCVGAPVHIKVEGVTLPLGEQPLGAKTVKSIAYSLMSEDQAKEFEQLLEMNLGVTGIGNARFRINIYKQRGDVGIVIRYIKGNIPTIEELGLPSLLGQFIMIKRGLILVVGSTGSGKSTTLAALIDHRNRNSTGHILTIEDPIEYVHPFHKSVISQREVGVDTLSYHEALKSALREAPDVILIGEIRDRETMQYAMSYAESGHLCIATLHANNTFQTIDRILHLFPAEIRSQILMDLSLNLQAIISQRLVIDVNKARVPAVEVLKPTPYIADLIQKGEIDKISDAMNEAQDDNVITFDHSLFELHRSGRISLEEALSNASSESDLSLRIRLDGGDDDNFNARDFDSQY